MYVDVDVYIYTYTYISTYTQTDIHTHSVHPPPPFLQRKVEPPIKFSKRGLDRTATFTGGCWERGT